MDIPTTSFLPRVRGALRTVRKFFAETPLVLSEGLSRALGCVVYLKLESETPINAYKVRGALNKIAGLDRRNVLRIGAASTGNHAQGVAFAASRYDLPCMIFMPENVPPMKVERTRSLGAQVKLTGKNFDETLATAQAELARPGDVFIHPFDDRDVIAGQGTIALELLNQQASLDAVVGPVGGGGLMAGISMTLKESGSEIRTYGVEPAALASLQAAIVAGRPTTIPAAVTLADGAAVRRVGELPYAALASHLYGLRPVAEASIEEAIRLLASEAKVVVEGAGALGIAALIEGHFRELQGKKVAVIVSGGNIDVQKFARILAGGGDANPDPIKTLPREEAVLRAA